MNQENERLMEEYERLASDVSEEKFLQRQRKSQSNELSIQISYSSGSVVPCHG